MQSHHIGGSAPRGGLILFVPGVVLVTLGVLILTNEALLRYLVAGFFVAAGAFLLSAAWQVRRGSLGSRLMGVLHSRLRGPFDAS